MNRSLRLSAAAALLVPALLVASHRPANAADGLAFVEAHFDNARGVNGLKGAQSVALSADGTSLYVAGAGDSAVAVFRRAAAGTLAFVEEQRQATNGVQGLGGASTVVVSPDGANVYAAGPADNSIVVFSRDTATGALAFLEAQRDNVADVVGLSNADALAMSPDGANLYAASSRTDTIVVFSRDAATGALTFFEADANHDAGIQGLSGVQAVAVSSDGKNLYAAGGGDLVTFAREPMTGSLTFKKVHHNGTADVAGLAGATAVVVSADGTSVYVAGKGDDAIAAFVRDPATGALTFAQILQQGLEGVDGLDGVNALAVSPDGAHVYAVGSTPTSKTLTVLARDADSSMLTVVGIRRNGTGGIAGLDGAAAVTVSADSAFVYTAAKGDAAVAVFSASCGDGIIDAGEQCDDGNGSDGDGCSAGCHLECASVADCDDGDPCTEARCRAGECVFPRCGLTGSLCAVTDGLTVGVPTLAVAGECSPVSPELVRMAKASLRAARLQIRVAKRQGLCTKKAKAGVDCPRTKNPSSKELKQLLKGVERSVNNLESAAARLVKKERITPECQGAVGKMFGGLDSDLKDMVLHKGVCAP